MLATIFYNPPFSCEAKQNAWRLPASHARFFQFFANARNSSLSLPDAVSRCLNFSPLALACFIVKLILTQY
jgi:hypothetical protein